LIDQFVPRDVDWTEVVAGQPMHHWNGKTRAQVVKQVGEEGADLVEKALEDRELTFPTSPTETDESEEFPGEEIPPVGQKPAESPATATGAIPPGTQPAQTTGSEPQGERVFAGYPYSELRDKSDDELRAMPNIGDRTIAAIREYEAGGA
jgi:hypothetical protein